MAVEFFVCTGCNGVCAIVPRWRRQEEVVGSLLEGGLESRNGRQR